MLDTSDRLHAGIDFGVPGRVAAALWALGVLAGVLALLTGHAGLAIAGLVLAVASPWFGLAYVSHNHRRPDESAWAASSAPVVSGPISLRS
ncbi:hypothetical protein AWC11_12555 [Mycobacterium interjectum]|jgi:hypothetical protein|uniref:Transmembrane protein n=1 Tax=Mycobacterium terramassiliense TaxID=1841859 RepID=A0A2U3NF18_9MYCO|nr:hypothetical protein [Mycobacterium terramassiliense]ORV90754.1 hypothetical protein AWC11_12555 [Mycobacterium interjectum]SPM30108.1 hypothetical protein ABH39_16750 [Mycobacterium terramassiliense]